MLPKLPAQIEKYWKKTLVLNLSGLLITTQYKVGRGYEAIKRPYLEQFLIELADIYEIVVFGDEDLNYITEVCASIDPNKFAIVAKFGRECTVFDYKFDHVKDLSYLGRDLNKIVAIDVDIKKLKRNTDNAIIIPRYSAPKGSVDDDDKDLLELIPLLKHLASPNVEDVRKELNIRGHFSPHKSFSEKAVKEAAKK